MTFLRPKLPGGSPLLSLLIAASLAGGCAQAAIDADAGLFDMGDQTDDDAALDASSEDTGAPIVEIDAAVPVDSGSPTWDTGAPRDAALDAKAEASVDAGARCIPGLYKGKFQGKISVKLIIELLELDITGNVDIEIGSEVIGDKVVLNNGKVIGTDQDKNPLEATVSGTLNCITGKLENGKLENGKYTRPLTGDVLFSGTVTANYTADPPSAEGTWKTSGGIESGTGTWNAALVP
jgi:hypothetical protein